MHFVTHIQISNCQRRAHIVDNYHGSRRLCAGLAGKTMWIIAWVALDLFITHALADLSPPASDNNAIWDRPKLKYDNYSFMALLPNPDMVQSGSLSAWNATSSINDFDNTIPTFEYTNTSGDLASAASGYSPSVARGWGPEGRQYQEDSGGGGGDYSKAYMPLITYFDVKCDKRGMHVHIEFNKPFNGIIFSKGFFNSPDCRYVAGKSYGRIYDFTVPVDYCGTTGEDHAKDYKDSYYENTIIIQFDEYIQEVWDLAKTIRCEWNAYYDKSVAVRPYNVGNLDPVLYRFNGDNIESWIQIQKGKGPWAEEVYGIVKVGDPLTVVIGIRDYEGKFDMSVKDCFATDGYGGRVQLTDYYGCVVRDKIMSPFRKVRDYGQQATVVAYAYFQAFKFPDRYEVGIKCNIQVCLGKCQGGCPGDYGGGGGGYEKPRGDYQNEPGYAAPPDYGAGGAYSSVNPTAQRVDLSQFGPGPYVPDIPPAPPGAPPYQGSYDTDHVIGVDTAVAATSDINNVDVPSKSKGPPPPPGAGPGPTLDPYRRKRDVENITSDNSTTLTVVVTTTTSTLPTESSSFAASSSTRKAEAHSRKPHREAKIVQDDGQINLDGKFKVIASHDIQSDNIKTGPQEVAAAATNAICITVASFTAGLTLLMAMLILSVLVTVFVCFRLRRYGEKVIGLAALPVRRAGGAKRNVGEFIQATTCWSPPILTARHE
ncbi:uncharacterized protein LOC129595672 [Paramacrobiotus metropolitanus]|uniref:uncharacterized protein LOC129595672 n=1 Tax=Paramacrobiotus metropolitanus TaxID=2943436 RepID=UPI00244637EC|nr:uncharacterized protein LOC129595672 [Paramacrobiotus metropolitanus]